MGALVEAEDRCKSFLRSSGFAYLLVAFAGISWAVNLRDVSVLSLILFLISGLRNWFARIEKKDTSVELIEVTDVIRPLKKEVSDEIHNGASSIHAVVGSSGVGKSILLEQLAEEAERKRYIVYRLRDYGRLPADKLDRICTEHRTSDRLLFVLDQFEKVFMLEAEGARTQLLALCSFFETLRESPWKCLLGLRKEYLADLKFFSEMNHALHFLGGFDPVSERSQIESFKRNLGHKLMGSAPEELITMIIEDCQESAKTLRTYHYSDCSKISDQRSDEPVARQVIPLEAVVACSGLVYAGKLSGSAPTPSTYCQVGRLRGSVERFFIGQLASFGSKTAISAAREETEAARVLYSLCVNPNARWALSAAQVSSLTQLPELRAQQILEHFQERRLLTRVENKFDWARDYYAEKFHEFTSTILQSLDRDNISFFWENRRHHETPEPLGSIRSDWAVGFYMLSILTLVIALFLPALSNASENLIDYKFEVKRLFYFSSTAAPNLHLSFLPVAISLGAWSWYVRCFHRRVLSRLSENAVGRVVSYLLPVWTFGLVLCSVALPAYWVVIIGLGGMAISIKFFQLHLQTGLRLRDKVAGNAPWYASAGGITFVNSVVTMGCGQWIVAEIYRSGSFLSGLPDWKVVGICIATMVLMLYGVFVCGRRHVRREVAPVLVGTFKRHTRFYEY